MAISALIGFSAKFRAVLDRIDMVAPVDSSVMIQGETGTGKEVIAQAIHQASPRRHSRFVAVNCAAIPGALVSSTAAAASSHDDSIPRISIALSPMEAAKTRAAAERVLRRARPAGRLPRAQLRRDRSVPRAPSRKRAGMRTGA